MKKSFIKRRKRVIPATPSQETHNHQNPTPSTSVSPNPVRALLDPQVLAQTHPKHQPSSYPPVNIDPNLEATDPTPSQRHYNAHSFSDRQRGPLPVDFTSYAKPSVEPLPQAHHDNHPNGNLPSNEFLHQNPPTYSYPQHETQDDRQHQHPYRPSSPLKRKRSPGPRLPPPTSSILGDADTPNHRHHNDTVLKHASTAKRDWHFTGQQSVSIAEKPDPSPRRPDESACGGLAIKGRAERHDEGEDEKKKKRAKRKSLMEAMAQMRREMDELGDSEDE